MCSFRSHAHMHLVSSPTALDPHGGMGTRFVASVEDAINTPPDDDNSHYFNGHTDRITHLTVILFLFLITLTIGCAYKTQVDACCELVFHLGVSVKIRLLPCFGPVFHTGFHSVYMVYTYNSKCLCEEKLLFSECLIAQTRIGQRQDEEYAGQQHQQQQMR